MERFLVEYSDYLRRWSKCPLSLILFQQQILQDRYEQSSRLVFRVLYLASFLIQFAFIQEDVEVYRSSPPLPGIFRPFNLLPSAHTPPKPNPEEYFSMESYIDSSDSEFGCAEAGEAAGEDESGGHSPSPSDGTRVDHPKGTRMTAWKRRGASQSDVDRYVLAYYCNGVHSQVVSSCFFSSFLIF